MKEDVAADHSNYIFLQSISIIIEMRMVKLRGVSYRPDAGLTSTVSACAHSRCPRGYRYACSPAIEAQLGFAGAVPCLAIPDLDALDSPITSAEVNWACTTAGGDPASDRHLIIGAAGVMNDNPIEFDRSAFDAELKRAEPSIGTANLDPVVIAISIDIGLTQINPWAWAAVASAISLGISALIKTGEQKAS
jgi:hypothetical protein